MLIVGERLNTSRPAAREMVARRDAAAVRQEAARQAEAGAAYIDVNAGTFLAEEPEVLRWMVTTVQEAVALPLCLDSPNPSALAGALRVHRGKALLNSITGEKARWDAVLPLVRDTGSAVVALALDDAGMPRSAAEAVAKGSRVVEKLLAAGVPAGDIFVDPLVRPVSADGGAAVAALDALRELRGKYPGVHAICGLSNVSFGLPRRSLVNQAFLAAAVAAGLDAAILDPLDGSLMALLLAAEAVLGLDPHCRRYLRAYRAGRLGPGGGNPRGAGAGWGAP